MRYHYKGKAYTKPLTFGKLYICDHPLYKRCTLFKIDDRGLAVVQKRFNKSLKCVWWDYVDTYLVSDIENQEGFKDFLESKAEKADSDGLYPTVGVRKIMWALRMKPLAKEYWECDL